jgi:hypothetical protein
MMGGGEEVGAGHCKLIRGCKYGRPSLSDQLPWLHFKEFQREQDFQSNFDTQSISFSIELWNKNM